MARTVFMAIVALATLAASGCATMTLPGFPGLADLPATAAAQPAPGMPSVTVEFRSPEVRTKRMQLPYTAGMTVQTAMEQSRATKHFRRMTVALVRTNPPHGRPHKMDIEFNSAKGRVHFTHDYALYPDDRLIVTEDTSTPLDDLISRIPGLGK